MKTVANTKSPITALEISERRQTSRCTRLWDARIDVVNDPICAVDNLEPHLCIYRCFG